MRGIVIQPKKEHKTQGSIALKKPSTSGRKYCDQKKIRTKEEKQKIMILMIFKALREFAEQSENKTICLETPRNSVKNGECIHSDESCEEMNFEDLIQLVQQCVDSEYWINDDDLYLYVKKIVFSIKSKEF